MNVIIREMMIDVNAANNIPLYFLFTLNATSYTPQAVLIGEKAFVNLYPHRNNNKTARMH